MRRLLPLLTLSACLASTAGAATPLECSAGLHRAMTAEIFFGRDIDANGAVSDRDWRQFLDAEVTPRFPEDVSVTDVYGPRREPSGRFAREAAKSVLLVVTGAPDEGQKLDLLRSAYAARFHQDSVLQVEQHACVGF